MKKYFVIRYVLLFFFLILPFIPLTSVYAASAIDVVKDVGRDINLEDLACGCRDELVQAYGQIKERDGVTHRCVSTYEEFLTDPKHLHFWVEDPEITAQGKADERARQFIYWVLHNSAIDDHPNLKAVWNLTRNISYFFVVIMAAVIGLGFIISQKTNFVQKVKVWPAVWKIVMALIYITFSASLLILMIQLSELLMKFFIETLGGKDLFNIYFSGSQSTEKSYTDFIGCRDLNIRAQEGVHAEVMMLKLTNITYYVMGIMIILRKILLWFLLFVSPFLAILMPFTFIRNTGWIWIGVFFQWLFYGPLFALFLAALAKIWKGGIPWPFDFSRVNTIEGYVYPTAINILYGGPAQKLQILNNGNYVDTFTEYIITLIMLWAVTFFPWWLLRIFRDYCCEGILAMKNILLSMAETRTMVPPIAPPPPAPVPTSPKTSTGDARKIPTDNQRTMPTRLDSIDQIKKSTTNDIMQTLQLSATKITDVARFETNKQYKQAITKNITYLSNPVKAQSPVERQKFMNIRTELFNRAIKEDRIAKALLSSTSTSQIEQIKKKEEILKSTPQSEPMLRVISNVISVPQEKVNSITNSFVENISKNQQVMNSISQMTQMPQQQIQNILNAYTQNIAQPTNQVINNISQQTNIAKEKITEVLKQANLVTQQSSTISHVASVEKISNETVEHILQTLPSSVEQRTTETTINQITKETSLNKEKVTEVMDHITQMQTQTNTTTLSKEKISEIATVTQTKETEVQKISDTMKQVTHESQPITKLISMTAQIPEAKAASITSSLINSVTNNQTMVENIQKQTGIDKSQVKTILTTYSQNINKPTEVINQKISQATGIEQKKVDQVLKKVVQNVSTNLLSTKDVVKDVAAKENVKVEDVQKVVDNQVPLVTKPEEHIEKHISIPSTISLEDYEEVKKMWTSQYEKGEVPVSENIANREEWVKQDIVMITNTLNKLLAPDETIRREGLDDLGFILPIFMINNLKGEELLVYLKAKLESAKAVMTDIEKEKEIREKLKTEDQNEDDLVELKRTKKDADKKELHMSLDLEEEEKKEKELADSKEDTTAPASEESEATEPVAEAPPGSDTEPPSNEGNGTEGESGKNTG